MTLRPRLKSAMAGICHGSGADRLFGAALGTRSLPVVVTYHRVVERFSARVDHIPSMFVSRAMLERHLDWLGRHYHIVTLDELGQRLESGRTRRPLAAVTFDDGYRDVYENAFPLLQRKGIPAAVFVVTDLVGTSRIQLHDRLYLLLAAACFNGDAACSRLPGMLADLGVPLRRVPRVVGELVQVLGLLLAALPQAQVEQLIECLEAELVRPAPEPNAFRPLSWEMLIRMQRNDVTIGSHTRSHALLTNERPERLRSEIAGSRALLESRLGTPVRHFAYPDGRFNAAVVAAVHDAYRYAYTICPHRSRRHPLLTIPRRVLWERSSIDAAGEFSPAVMSCQLSGLFDVISRCRRRHGDVGAVPAAAL
jgi:peptidoglycan/xylan/chitin deacetylase (PgdA/CDA1 family)